MKVLSTDLASFTGAGHGSVRIPEGVQLEPGETLYLIDDEADAVEADIVSVAGYTAQVRIRWDRSPVPVFDLELSPMARQSGTSYLHDVYLDVGEQVAPGDRVLIRDEGGDIWIGDVGARTAAGRAGHKYLLRIRPAR